MFRVNMVFMLLHNLVLGLLWHLIILSDNADQEATKQIHPWRITVNVLKVGTLYSILFWGPKFCFFFFYNCCLKYLVKWQTV